MKLKRLFLIGIFIAVIVLVYWLFSRNGPDREFSRGRFFVEGGALMMSDELGSNIPEFKIKGIVYSPYYPGETGGEDLPNDGRYEDHLKKAKSVGANTLSLFPQKMPAEFFQTLEREDLFYAQIINLTLYDGTDNSDLLNEEYQQKTKEHLFSIIDHNYSVGSPERLIYFALGYELNPGIILNTNHLHPNETSFSGRFIKLENRQPAEIALAKLLDSAMIYEAQTYNRLSLYTHISFSAYEAVNFKADFFDILAFNIYPSYYYAPRSQFNSGFPDYLSKNLSLASKPFIITELGLPSVLESGVINGVPPYGNNSEEDVANFYHRVTSDIALVQGLSGLFVFEFMDEHWKNGEEENDAFSHNPEDQEEWFGLYRVEEDEAGRLYLAPKELIIEAVRELLNSF